MFFDLVLGLKNLFLKIKYRDTCCDIILSMIIKQIGVIPTPDHETRDLISKQGYNTLQKALLMRLQEIAPNLTTYQAGSVAPAQIISDGKYVLEDDREIRKIQAVLSDFMVGSVKDNLGIRDRQRITWDDTSRLLKFLRTKGYQERNIVADFKARISPDPDKIRENLGTLSQPPEQMSHGIVTSLILKKLTDSDFVPETNRLAVSGGDSSYMQVGRNIKEAFADLIVGDKTFSPELIKNIAEQEKISKDGGILHQDTKADGGREHIALVLERFLDLQAALQDHFKENEPAVAKITAAITNEYLDNVRKALNVTT
jgi:hypothetical protein